MRAEFRIDLKSWSLIPTIGIRTLCDDIVIEWLCMSLWLDDTSISRYWSSKHVSVSVGHLPTHLSLPTLRIDLKNKSIDTSILGFYLSIYFRFGEEGDLPF